jgi:hypothetical protein
MPGWGGGGGEAAIAEESAPSLQVVNYILMELLLWQIGGPGAGNEIHAGGS